MSDNGNVSPYRGVILRSGGKMNFRNKILRIISVVSASAVLLTAAIWISVEAVLNSVYSALSAYGAETGEIFLYLKLTAMNYDTVKIVFMCVIGIFICASVVPLMFVEHSDGDSGVNRVNIGKRGEVIKKDNAVKRTDDVCDKAVCD